MTFTEQQQFLAQVAMDEQVISKAGEAMQDKEQIVAAIYRMTGSFEFPSMLADLVIARRQRNATQANAMCAEILYRVEDNIIEQIRKGVQL